MVCDIFDSQMLSQKSDFAFHHLINIHETLSSYSKSQFSRRYHSS